MSDNEWQRMVQRVLQRVTKNDNEWQWMTASDSEWQWVIKNNNEWQRVIKQMKTIEIK